jgi:hypothetical protein
MGRRREIETLGGGFVWCGEGNQRERYTVTYRV